MLRNATLYQAWSCVTDIVCLDSSVTEGVITIADTEESMDTGVATATGGEKGETQQPEEREERGEKTDTCKEIIDTVGESVNCVYLCSLCHSRDL